MGFTAGDPEVADEMTGTSSGDVLIGDAGDDTFFGLGGGDRIHGGPGDDLAVMRGLLEDYEFRRDGLVLIAKSDVDEVRLVSVELLEFDGHAEPLLIDAAAIR